MGQECFKCNKELGRLSVKWKISDLIYKKIPIPPGMTEEDRFCNDCYDIEKKNVKEQEKEFSKGKQAEFNQQLQKLSSRTPEYKARWNKNGVIQFKNERIAILQRMWGAQVEFIIAYDDLTNEGYRCIAHDEGKEGGSGLGATGGINSYFYFQKMECVR